MKFHRCAALVLVLTLLALFLCGCSASDSRQIEIYDRNGKGSVDDERFLGWNAENLPTVPAGYPQVHLLPTDDATRIERIQNAPGADPFIYFSNLTAVQEFRKENEGLVEYNPLSGRMLIRVISFSGGQAAGLETNFTVELELNLKRRVVLKQKLEQLPAAVRPAESHAAPSSANAEQKNGEGRLMPVFDHPRILEIGGYFLKFFN